MSLSSHANTNNQPFHPWFLNGANGFRPTIHVLRNTQKGSRNPNRVSKWSQNHATLQRPESVLRTLISWFSFSGQNPPNPSNLEILDSDPRLGVLVAQLLQTLVDLARERLHPVQGFLPDPAKDLEFSSGGPLLDYWG